MTDAEMQKIASLAADAVWKKLMNGKTAQVRLVEASDDATSNADPTGRGMKFTTHDHVKWIAKLAQEINAKLDKLLEQDNA